MNQMILTVEQEPYAAGQTQQQGADPHNRPPPRLR